MMVDITNNHIPLPLPVLQSWPQSSANDSSQPILSSPLGRIASIDHGEWRRYRIPMLECLLDYRTYYTIVFYLKHRCQADNKCLSSADNPRQSHGLPMMRAQPLRLCMG